MALAQQSELWTEVGRVEEIPRLGSRVVKTTVGNIAIFRTADDEVFALLDKCPHKGGPLSQGIVHDKKVSCPLHDWKIQLQSGEAVAPDVGCTPAYPIRVEEGVIFLELSPK